MYPFDNTQRASEHLASVFSVPLAPAVHRGSPVVTVRLRSCSYCGGLYLGKLRGDNREQGVLRGVIKDALIKLESNRNRSFAEGQCLSSMSW